MFKDNINLNLYKTFYDVAKAGSISKAADETYTSQPAISKSIKNLEKELDTKLFFREKNGVSLTDKGKVLYEYIESSYDNLVLAQRKILETENLERGKLLVGMPSNIGSFFLFDKLFDFHRKYPNIEITIITGGTSKLIELLNTHKLDFVIDSSPINIKSDELTIKKLDEASYCFVVIKNSKIVNYNKIKSLKDLKNIPLILPIKGTANRIDLDKTLNKYNITPTNVLNIHTSEIILSAVKKDLGVGYIIYDLVSDDVKKGEFIKLDIKEKLPITEINIVYNKKYLTTAPIKFIETYIDKNLDLN